MERLLLVEHRRLFGEGVALLFEWRTGLGCVQAGSLAEARAILEEAADHKPACVVVDLDLPEGEGTEGARGSGWGAGAGADRGPKP